MFSKHKSERMPLQKPYDHAIDFMESTKLSKPTKVYPLSLVERNSLDTWIDKELRKGYICLSTSPIAASFFFVKKHNRSLWPIERVQNGIAYWDKQNTDVPAPNCVLKVQEEIIKDKGL